MQNEQRKGSPPGASIEGTWRPSSANTEARTVDLVWTTGADVERYDFATGETYIERLHVDAAAVDLSRLNRGAPLLDSHEIHGVRNTLGVVERAWLEARNGIATVRFSERASDVFADVVDGVIRNVSVGYARDELHATDEKINGLPVREVSRWTPHELSFVTVPADAGAQVRGEHKVMTNESTTTATAVVEERNTRAADITTLVGLAKLPAEFASKLIREGTSLDEARRIVVDQIADTDETEVSHHVLPGGDTRAQSFTAAAAEGLLVRERILKDTESSDARQFVDALLAHWAQSEVRITRY